MGIFKKPKAPTVTQEVIQDTPAPVPERSTTETQALAEEQRKRLSREGRASTMLTGGGGASGAISASQYLGSAART